MVGEERIEARAESRREDSAHYLLFAILKWLGLVAKWRGKVLSRRKKRPDGSEKKE